MSIEFRRTLVWAVLVPIEFRWILGWSNSTICLEKERSIGTWTFLDPYFIPSEATWIEIKSQELTKFRENVIIHFLLFPTQIGSPHTERICLFPIDQLLYIHIGAIIQNILQWRRSSETTIFAITYLINFREWLRFYRF